MPPRFAYWTILIDDKPTAFRARDQQELLPTLTQLKRTNQNVVMKWFAQGRLWDSQEAQRESWRKPKPPVERRGRDWRPGGDHQDPRARFDKKAQKRKREQRAQWDQRPPSGPPRQDRPRTDRPAHGWSGKPGARPWTKKPKGERKPWAGKPQGERRPWAGKPSGEQRPWAGKPSGERRPWARKPSGERRPWAGKPPASGTPRGDRPWQTKPTGPRAQRKPWQHKPAGPRADRKPWQSKPPSGQTGGGGWHPRKRRDDEPPDRDK